MGRFSVACCVLAIAVCGAARAQDVPGEPKLYEVRQTYALPVTDYLPLFIDAFGANVTLENGPAGLVEAVFLVADTLHPPVFDQNVLSDSTTRGSLPLRPAREWTGCDEG